MPPARSPLNLLGRVLIKSRVGNLLATAKTARYAMLKAQNDFLTLSPQSEKASARYDQWGM